MSTPKPSSASARAAHEKDRIARQAQQVRTQLKPKTQLTPIKTYLVAYNALSAFLWGSILILTIYTVLTATPSIILKATITKSSPLSKIWGKNPVPTPLSHLTLAIDRLKGTYDKHGLGQLVKWTQTLAVLEVIHSLFGWVRSPVGTTTAQVFSRLWTVWGVVEADPATHNHPLFTTMIFAWSLTEVIRYTFYATSVLGITIPGLNWLRYTTFLPLYPLGASSEAFLSYSTLPPLSNAPFLPEWLRTLSPVSTAFKVLPAGVGKGIMKSEWGRSLLWNLASAGITGKKLLGAEKQWGTLEIARFILFLGWWPALYVLFTHMLGQRRKVLGKGRTLKAKTA